MEEPLEHLRRARELFEAASRLPGETSLILYAAAAEAAVAAILSSSSARRSKRLCTSSTRRLINMAIVELARLRILDAEKASMLRRGLQAIRCRRNRLLHPSVECIRERCEDISPEQARAIVGELISSAEKLLELRGMRSSV